MYKLISMSINAPEIVTQNEWNANFSFQELNIVPVALIGLFVTLASAYRLAKFNIDEDQQTYFKGLPTPANALLVLSLPLIIQFQNSSFATNLILNQWFLIAFTLVSCYLLNSKVKLFALKFKDYSLANNKFRYLLILSTAVLLVVLHFIAIPIIILLYIILSLIKK
jgi:CDP-diacylglycerol--serine O-phosphatidyltransferase